MSDKVRQRIYRNTLLLVLAVSLFVIVLWTVVDFPDSDGRTEQPQNSIQFDLAKKAYYEARYEDSKSLFLKVKDSSEVSEAKIFLNKIDSISQATTSIQNTPHRADNSKSKLNRLNLIKQKIFDWKAASIEDRIYVCTAFVNEFNKLSPKKLSPIDIFNCIEEATRGLDSTNDIPIGTMMTLCSQEILKQ